MAIHVEIIEEAFDLARIDLEVQEAVALLREQGVDTFASCSGHGNNNPWIRCQPCDPERLFRTLLGLGYDGFYVKEYRSGPVGPQVIFTEIEFWNLDCLNRKCNEIVAKTITIGRELKMKTGTQAAQIKYPMRWEGGLLLGPTLIYINENGIPIELRLNDGQVQMIVDDWNTRDVLGSEIGEEVEVLRPPLAA